MVHALGMIVRVASTKQFLHDEEKVPVHDSVALQLPCRLCLCNARLLGQQRLKGGTVSI